MNGKEKAIPFLDGFVKNLGNFLFGNPTDKEGNIKPLDPRYKGPGFQGLPEHQKEKEYELLRKQGPQAFAPINNDFGMMQEIPQFFNPLTGRKEAVDGGGMLFAGAPRFIQSSPPPNVINKAPHIDSRYMDRLLEERNKMMGVQLPPFV
tara:strand:- start:1475 stop:1921 length:447 start_codon:yes stop_codon:yes gene_type:complete